MALVTLTLASEPRYDYYDPYRKRRRLRQEVPPTLAALAVTLGTQPATAAAVLLAQCDVDTLDLAGLERAEKFLDRIKVFTAANDVRLARRRRELAEAGKAAPVDRSNRGQLSAREQRAAAGREDVCDRLPVVEDALAAGQIGAGACRRDRQRDRSSVRRREGPLR